MSDPSGQQAAWELTKSLERKLGRPLNTTEQQVLGYFGMDHVYKPRASGAGRGNWISLSAHPLRDLHPALEFAAAELSPVEAEIAVRLAAFIAKDSVGGHVKQARRELAVGFGGKPANSWLQGTGGWLLQVLLQCSLAHQDFWPLAAVPVALGCAWLQRVLYKPWRLRILRQVEEQLPRSNILERLGENDPALEAILRHTPAPFRWLFLGFPANRLADRTKLVARNLDWYLQPPDYWFSPRWISPLISNIATVGAVLAIWLATLQHYSGSFNLGWSFVALMAMTPLQCESDVDLSAYFADALLAQMKQRFDERLAESGMVEDTVELAELASAVAELPAAAEPA